MSTGDPAIREIGELDRRVTLQVKSETTDDYGQPIVTWTDVATVWGKVDPLRGLERVEASQLAAHVDTRFTIRYRTDVRPGQHRVSYDGRLYNIVNVAERGRREALELDAGWTDAPTGGLQRREMVA